MSSSLLIDFNNLGFRNFFIKDIGYDTPEPDYQTWKYITINSILKILQQNRYINEVVICMDDNKSWRKKFFPRYKESRKPKRDKQKYVDWNLLYSNFNELAYDMKTMLPFKVFKINSAEADDIIGVLSLFVIKGNIIVLSNDEDYRQLLTEKRIKVYNPTKKCYIETTKEEANMFIINKSFLGQNKDDIFNILTPRDWGLTPETEGKRKPGFGPAALKKVMEYKGGWEQWLKDKDLEKRFHRNKVLMDFRMIPPIIRNAITKSYNEYELPDADNIYKFFKENHFRDFLENFTSIENRLLNLY